MEMKRCVNCMEEITGSICPHCGYQEGSTEQMAYGLKRNSILHGRYLIGNVLGQGGFGITYIGFDMALNIKVAIKEYYPMGIASRDCTYSNRIVWNTSGDGQEQWQKGCENFLKEARRMAQIDVLPEIVRVRDTFMENQTSYIVMEYVEGETLKTWILKNGTMTFPDCVRLLLPLMQSLNEVHKRKLIHRDISPDNIMVLPEGKVRLLDLGAAKELSVESNGNSQLVTKKGFSPPEQYMDSGKVGTWTDVYALCATIYYCITGKLVSDAMERLMGDALSFDVPMREPLSREVVEILQKGLAIKAEDRIQTVEELVCRLQKTVFPPDLKPKFLKGMVGIVGILLVLCIVIKIFGGNSINSETESLDLSEEESNISAAEFEKSTTEETVTSSVEDTAEKAYLQNVLMEDKLTFEENEERWTFGNDKLARSSIAVITFLDTLKDMPKEEAWDVSQEQNGTVMAWTKPSGQEQAGFDLYIAAKGGVVVYSGQSLFAGYENVTEIQFNHCFHTDGVTNMENMFLGCSNLKELDMSDFDTRQVTNMRVMFYQCSSLGELELSSFNTSQVTKMEHMFRDCSSLKELDLSNFNTSRVTDMNCMFAGCSSLGEVDLNSFNTSQVTNMKHMFGGCSSLKELDLSNFNTSQVTNMGSMFNACNSIKKIDLSSFITNRVTDMSFMFCECSNIKGLDVSGFDTRQVTNMRAMFDRCSSLGELDLNSFNTSQVTDMRGMFYGCNSLGELNLNSFHTSQVTDMGYMFYGCSSIQKLDLSGFDTRQVTNMRAMFDRCSSLEELDLNSFNTSQVTDMRGMFYGCNSLGELNLNSFNTSQVTNMGYMFYGCSSIQELDLSGFDMSQVTDTENMLNNAGITAQEAGLSQ